MSGNMQQEFPAYYTALCARVADAIDALEQQNYGAARDALISGMQEAEEIILTQENGSPAKRNIRPPPTGRDCGCCKE